MISLKKVSLIAMLALFSGGVVYAQDKDEEKEEEKTEKVKKERPRVVRDAFGSSIMLEHQTVLTPKAKTLVLNMQHRFGKLWNSDGFDLLGLYANGANIRIGFEYSIIDQLQIGFGTEKNHLAQDFSLKWSILQQRKGMPIFLTAYANMAIEAGKKDQYMSGGDYKVGHRFSYYYELMIARKFHKRFSLQVSAAYSHFNVVDNTVALTYNEGTPNEYNVFHDARHDNVSIGALARVKITSQTSLILGYDQTLTPAVQDYELNYPYNASVGVEISTSSHSFQIFIGNRNGILGQYNMAQNQYDITKGDFLLGFNITRLWGF